MKAPIRKWREAAKLDLREAAAALKVHFSTLSRWENWLTVPDAAGARKIAAKTGQTFAEVIEQYDTRVRAARARR